MKRGVEHCLGAGAAPGSLTEQAAETGSKAVEEGCLFVAARGAETEAGVADQAKV